MNFKSFNDAFDKKFQISESLKALDDAENISTNYLNRRLDEKLKLNTFSDYINNHADNLSEKNPSLEVSRDHYIKQLKGKHSKKRNSVSKFFNEHPTADAVVITEEKLDGASTQDNSFFSKVPLNTLARLVRKYRNEIQ